MNTLIPHSATFSCLTFLNFLLLCTLACLCVDLLSCWSQAGNVLGNSPACRQGLAGTPHHQPHYIPGLLQERCTGSMGSLGLPRMALLKMKPGVFYSNWLENKSAFCCFRVCSGKLVSLSFLGTLLQSCHVHTPHLSPAHPLVPCAHCMQWDTLHAGQPRSQSI